MYVRLDPIDQGCKPLTKVIESDDNSTFDDLVKRLLDPRADKYNPGYNPSERETAEVIAEQYQQTAMQPYVSQLTAKTNEGTEIPIGLNDPIKKYYDQIANSKTKVSVDGFEGPCDLIDLSISENVPGGLKKD